MILFYYFCHYCRATNNEQDSKHKITIPTKNSEGSSLGKIRQRTAMADKAAQVVITEQQAHQEAEETIL